MDFDNNTPIYLQVIHSIKKKVLSGELAVGQKLPSTRELAYMYQINPNTASRVYSEMELMGLCFTKRGLGTFLSEDEGVVNRIKQEYMDELIHTFILSAKEIGIDKDELLKTLEGEWNNVRM